MIIPPNKPEDPSPEFRLAAWAFVQSELQSLQSRAIYFSPNDGNVRIETHEAYSQKNVRFYIGQTLLSAFQKMREHERGE